MVFQRHYCYKDDYFAYVTGPEGGICPKCKEPFSLLTDRALCNDLGIAQQERYRVIREREEAKRQSGTHLRREK